MRKIKIIGQGIKSYSSRKVKSTWYNKTLGKVMTEEYTYEGYKTTERRSRLIVKNGKITKYGKELRDQLVRKLGDEFTYKVDEKIHAATKDNNNLRESTLISQLERALEQAARKDDEGASRSKIRGFIYNMGGDVDSLAEDLGITKDDLLNPEKWEWIKGSDEAHFTFGGFKYTFHFKYEENAITWTREVVQKAPK